MCRCLIAALTAFVVLAVHRDADLALRSLHPMLCELQLPGFGF